MIDLCISTILNNRNFVNVYTEDIDREWIEQIEISENIANNIIILSKNNQLIHYFRIYSKIRNLNLYVYPSMEFYSIRNFASGLNNPNVINKRECSLRSKMGIFCQPLELEFANENFYEKLLNNSHFNQFEMISETREYIYFSKKLFKSDKKIKSYLPLTKRFLFLKNIRIIIRENIFPKLNQELHSLIIENIKDIFEFYDKDVYTLSQYLTEYSYIDIEFFEEELKELVCSIFDGRKQLSYLHQIGQSLLFLIYKSDFKERDKKTILEISKSYFESTENINAVDQTSHALRVTKEIDSGGILNIKNVTVTDILETIYLLPILVTPNNLSDILLFLSKSSIPIKYKNSYIEKSLFNSFCRILSENVSVYNLTFLKSLKNDKHISELYTCVLAQLKEESYFDDDFKISNHLNNFSLNQLFVLLFYLNQYNYRDCASTIVEFIYTNFEHNNTLLSLLSFFPNDKLNCVEIKNYFSSKESINDALLFADKIDYELIVHIFYELSLSNSDINSDDLKIDYFDSLIYFQT